MTQDRKPESNGPGRFEYRVGWMREGDKRPRYRIYQTKRGADQYVDTLKGNYDTTDDYPSRSSRDRSPACRRLAACLTYTHSLLLSLAATLRAAKPYEERDGRR